VTSLVLSFAMNPADRRSRLLEIRVEKHTDSVRVFCDAIGVQIPITHEPMSNPIEL